MFAYLPVLKVLAAVSCSEDDTTCAPGKLVPERVVARLGGRQATAVRGKLKYLPHTQRHKTTERERERERTKRESIDREN